jgi:hypothetical protein
LKDEPQSLLFGLRPFFLTSPFTLHPSPFKEHVMPKAERGVVKPPNEEHKGNRRANGFLSLAPSPSPVTPTNLSRFMHGDAGGSGSLARQASAIPESNRRFDVNNVENCQVDKFPVEPGRGAVPVNPFLAGGPGLARAMPIPDDAEQVSR